MELIDQHVESLIFTSGQPISENEITTSVQRALDENISKEDVDASIERLMEKYKSEDFAFEIVPISKGYHFMTKGAFHTTVGEHLKVISKKKLSRAALETLSIIAYKQPVTRIDLESIRGVSCDYTIQKLMEKELVEMQGRAEGPGRPLLYGTSEKFMDYFGIKDLKDLPKPKDFEMPETEVGEPAPIEVVVPKESNESDESIESEMTESMLEVAEVRSEEIVIEDKSKEANEIIATGTSDEQNNGVHKEELETQEGEQQMEISTEEVAKEELSTEEVDLVTDSIVEEQSNGIHNEKTEIPEGEGPVEMSQIEEKIEIQNSSEEEE